MPSRSSNRPRDANQLAKQIVDIATGETEDPRRPVYDGKNPAAVELGRLGGRKGGRAQAEKLSAPMESKMMFQFSRPPNPPTRSPDSEFKAWRDYVARVSRAIRERRENAYDASEHAKTR